MGLMELLTGEERLPYAHMEELRTSGELDRDKIGRVFLITPEELDQNIKLAKIDNFEACLYFFSLVIRNLDFSKGDLADYSFLEKFSYWLQQPSQPFGGMTPLSAIKEYHGIEQVVGILENALLGVPD